MKKKGFTLVELLVVIAIIALLMGILMPALARVRQVAYRMVCGSNLSGIGKAMLIYANDYDEQYPRAGGRDSRWTRSKLGKITLWYSTTGAVDAYGTGIVTVTSSLYLLVKYADVTPKQFICKGDIGADVFELSDESDTPINFEIVDAWDFGSNPGKRNSYGYHMPYANMSRDPAKPMSPVLNPASPLCADRNLYFDINAELYTKDGDLKDPSLETTSVGNTTREVYTDDDRKGNSACHQREGQNVLFNDSHVAFERFPNVGIDNDNIYQSWQDYDPTEPRPVTQEEKQVDGQYPVSVESSNGRITPQDFRDAVLASESNDKDD